MKAMSFGPFKGKDWAGRGALLLALLALLGACAEPAGQEQNADNGAAATPPATPPAEGWPALLAREPYPYLLPLMEDEPTALDGTYVKHEPPRGEAVHCLRCPDYAREAGLWKLQLARGAFRIYHQEGDWSSLGSFLVTKDRLSKVEDPDKLLLFNDPYCPDIVGVYRWERTEDGLRLEAVDDTCSYRLRAANLSNLPWLSCTPPNLEAAVTDHWPKPEGCD